MRHVLAKRAGVKPNELEAKGFLIESAGTQAWKGLPPPENVVLALKELGMEGDQHRSRPVTSGMITSADVVYGMAGEHVDWMRTWHPKLSGHIVPFDEKGDVKDPMGGDLESFRACARHIEIVVEEIVRRL